jgi:hypothetical protein
MHHSSNISRQCRKDPLNAKIWSKEKGDAGNNTSQCHIEALTATVGSPRTETLAHLWLASRASGGVYLATKNAVEE